MVCGIDRDPMLHSSGMLVCSIRTDWGAMQQQQRENQLASVLIPEDPGTGGEVPRKTGGLFVSNIEHQEIVKNFQLT